MSLLRLRVSGEWGSYDIQAVAVKVRTKRNGLSLPTSASGHERRLGDGGRRSAPQPIADIDRRTVFVEMCQ